MILGTITTYNPEMDLLEQNINAVIGQVDKLLVYENGSENRAEIVSLCKGKGIEVILNEENEGVAGPLYDGVEYAKKNGYEFIFTLDQDSVVSDGMVQKLAEILRGNGKIAMVCGTRVLASSPECTVSDDYCAPVNSLITSGTLGKVDIIYEVGNYLRELFIDGVDNEICYRLKKRGYFIYSCGVKYQHCIGNPIRHRLLSKTFYVLNYSPFRVYYTWRNCYVIFRLYKHEKYIKGLKRHIRHSFIKILLWEKGRTAKLKAMRSGKRDSKKLYKELKEKYLFL